jgi:hypothetical protein
MGSATDADVRLACTHSAGSSRCHQGRIEVNSPSSGWGTVCGHWTWNTDGAANVACRELGYEGGSLYTCAFAQPAHHRFFPSAGSPNFGTFKPQPSHFLLLTFTAPACPFTQVRRRFQHFATASHRGWVSYV